MEDVTSPEAIEELPVTEQVAPEAPVPAEIPDWLQELAPPEAATRVVLQLPGKRRALLWQPEARPPGKRPPLPHFQEDPLFYSQIDFSY